MSKSHIPLPLLSEDIQSITAGFNQEIQLLLVEHILYQIAPSTDNFFDLYVTPEGKNLILEFMRKFPSLIDHSLVEIIRDKKYAQNLILDILKLDGIDQDTKSDFAYSAIYSTVKYQTEENLSFCNSVKEYVLPIKFFREVEYLYNIGQEKALQYISQFYKGQLVHEYPLLSFNNGSLDPKIKFILENIKTNLIGEAKDSIIEQLSAGLEKILSFDPRTAQILMISAINTDHHIAQIDGISYGGYYDARAKKLYIHFNNVNDITGLLGLLAHEATHNFFDIVYNNSSEPFKINDEGEQALQYKIVESIMADIKAAKLTLQSAIQIPSHDPEFVAFSLENYGEGDLVLEVPAYFIQQNVALILNNSSIAPDQKPIFGPYHSQIIQNIDTAIDVYRSHVAGAINDVCEMSPEILGIISEYLE